MTKLNPYLFVYGTLLQKNEIGRFLSENSALFCKAKFKGKLYDIGQYPGAVTDESGNFLVYGRVFLMNNPEETFIKLDDYEGYGDDQEQPNLFVRNLTEVETADGKLQCWIYLYNLPVTGLKQITSGKYQD